MRNSILRRAGVAVAAFLVGVVVASTGSARAEAVTVKVTASDKAAAQHLTTTYLHASPMEGHTLSLTERIHPSGRRAPAAIRPPTATALFDPNNLTYGSAPGLGGAYLTTARLHNVYVNCPLSGPSGNKIARCWGTTGTNPTSVPTPDQFLIDYGQGGLSHVTDQYVGSTAAGRYPLSTDVYVNYPLSSNQASYQDLLNIVMKSATALGHAYAGYGDLYVVYFPKGADVCTATACFSQKAFCAFHGSAEGTIQGYPLHLLFAAMPYQDVTGCSITRGPNEVNDSMVSAVSHEVTEAITDPDGDAWYNYNDTLLAGSEIADECQLNGFSRYPTITLNGHQYKMQLEYSNVVRDCVDQP